jgi:hypothetical protein
MLDWNGTHEKFQVWNVKMNILIIEDKEKQLYSPP